MRALRTVEREGLRVLGRDFGGSVRCRVHDATGLALRAGVEHVDKGEDEGRGGGEEDVADGCVSLVFWREEG